MILRLALVALAVLTMGGCRSEAKRAPAAPEVAWQPLASWSGREGLQTESFPSETGAFRVKWETRNEAKPGAGRFTLAIHSAISGRPLATVVDHTGVGKDVAYVNEDPRVFFFVVSAANVDWSFTADEGVPVTRTPSR